MLQTPSLELFALLGRSTVSSDIYTNLGQGLNKNAAAGRPKDRWLSVKQTRAQAPSTSAGGRHKTNRWDSVDATVFFSLLSHSRDPSTKGPANPSSANERQKDDLGSETCDAQCAGHKARTDDDTPMHGPFWLLQP